MEKTVLRFLREERRPVGGLELMQVSYRICMLISLHLVF
jgi:hypothetical protein